VPAALLPPPVWSGGARRRRRSRYRLFWSRSAFGSRRRASSTWS